MTRLPLRSRTLFMLAALPTAIGLIIAADAPGGPGAPGQQPWFTAHLAEIDTNKDGILGLDEVERQTTRAFTGYDGDGNGEISQAELKGAQAKTALGGFVKGHAQEIDANHDGKLTRPEITAVLMDMFRKQDSNHDSRLDAAELAAPQRPPGGPRPDGDGKGGEGKGQGKDGDGKRPPRAALPPVESWPTRTAQGWSWPGKAPGAHVPGDGSTPPTQAASFIAIGSAVRVSWDEQYLYVESLSLPDHPLMAGITAWNQQVPLPQPYVGANAFRIPLKPVALATPQPLTLEGPVALAANGIPIFAPTTQSGNDAFQHGELDAFGGHCGRADDYHYHLAPLHLQKAVGAGQPVAFGLDGYAISAPETPAATLDAAHGHQHADGSYHYHSSATAPYYMGAFHGQADLEGRPRTAPVRPYLQPLRGATITGMTGSVLEQNGATLTYTLGGKEKTLHFVRLPDGGMRFALPSDSGVPQTTDYPPAGQGGGQGQGGGKERRRKDGPPPVPGEERPPRPAP